MRPVLLKISGLNSFVEEEEIDFTKLVEKGLFGIFGPTGSGKSSILDAVTIALYGRISRDTKEFINKEKEELYVYFEFELQDNKYTVERKLQISDTGGYNTTLARLIIDENSQERVFDKVSLIDEKIEEVIGLNHEDFMRTVVLPQGKFSRFLKLTGRDRRDMLERILNLEEFGERLMKRLKKQRDIRQEKIGKINAILSNYQEVNRESLKEEKENLKQLISTYKDITRDLTEKKKEYDKYKQVRKLQGELEDYQNRQDKLAEQKEEIAKKKSNLVKTRQAVSIKSDLNRYKECSKQIKDNRVERESLLEEIKSLTEKKHKLAEEYETLVEQKEKELPVLTEKKIKIKTALELKEKNQDLSSNISSKQQEYEGLQKSQEKLKSEIDKIKEDIKEEKSVIEAKESRMDKLQVSSDYRKDVAGGLELENNYKQKKEQLDKIKEEKAAVIDSFNQDKQSLTNLQDELKDIEAQILQVYDKKLNNLEQEKDNSNDELKILKDKIKLKEEKLQELKKEIKEIETRNMAGILAGSLKEGKPCPVCGSPEHPVIAEEVETDLTTARDEREKLEKDLQALQEKRNKLSSGLTLTENEIGRLKKERINLITTFSNDVDELLDITFTELLSLDNLQKKREETREEISKLNGSLKTNQENIGNIDKKLGQEQSIFNDVSEEYIDKLQELAISSFTDENKTLGEKDKQRELIQQEIKTVKEELEDRNKKLEHMQKEFNDKEKILLQENNELEKIKEKLAENDKMIKVKVGEKDPSTYLKQVEDREIELNKSVKQKKENFKESEDELNKKKNLNNTIEDRLERLQEETSKLEGFLEQNLSKFEFSDIEEAQTYLVWEDNIEKWEKELEEFRNQLNEITNNIKRLEKELDGESIGGEQWEKLTEEKSALEKKQEELQEKIGGQKTTIEKLKEELEDKKKKDREKKELDYELSLIKEIDDLVRGKSFVEFVAIRQLRYIAREASERLMEITNNRYRLELNDQGEFVICDLYSGGVKRGCNTLSGGETFLTSLSLALALSSQIQLKGSSSMEFFFLDEGFGTLDANLLDIVMNSLEKLQNENLSVGIISHVEELKNRVPVKLLVEPAQPGIRGTKVRLEYS